MIERALTDQEVEEIKQIWKRFLFLNQHKESDFLFFTYAQTNLLDSYNTYITTHDGYVADKQESYDLLYASDSLAHCILLAWKSLYRLMQDVKKHQKEYDSNQVEQSLFYLNNLKTMTSYYKRLQKTRKQFIKQYKKEFLNECKQCRCS